MPDDFGSWKWISQDGVEYDLSDEPDIEVIDYANIGMPPATINTTPSALSGANVNLSRINAHRIPLVLKFQGDSFVANQAKLDDLRKTLFPIGAQGPRTGFIQHTRGTGRVSRIPAISETGLQQAGNWYKGPANWVFSAIFLALRPTWRGIYYTPGIVETDLALAGGLEWPAEWPIEFPPTRVQVTAAIDNVGDAIATKIEFTLIPNKLGIKNPTVLHHESGRFASVKRQFPENQKILFYNISPDDIGVITGNSNLAPYLDTASRGMPIFLGDNTFTVYCEEGGGTVQMRYLPEYNGG